MTDIIKVAAYWKVFGRSSAEIDAIENTLRQISGTSVTRTESFVGNDIFDAVYCVKGEAVAENFVDACHFMTDVDAFPF